MFQGFKNFIMKGNVVDMAVGVVIGVAFGNVVTALVKDLVTPLIGVFGQTPDLSSLTFSVNGSQFLIGDFLNTLISFLMIAAVIYFAVVAPMSKLTAKAKSGKSDNPAEKICPECLSLIPAKAKKCRFCTSTQNK